MKTVIIYKDSGEIIFSQSGNDVSADGGVNIVEADVPDGYYVKSVDPETNEPVLEPIPKTEEQQRIDALEAQMNALLGVESEETA